MGEYEVNKVFKKTKKDGTQYMAYTLYIEGKNEYVSFFNETWREDIEVGHTVKVGNIVTKGEFKNGYDLELTDKPKVDQKIINSRYKSNQNQEILDKLDLIIEHLGIQPKEEQKEETKINDPLDVEVTQILPHPKPSAFPNPGTWMQNLTVDSGYTLVPGSILTRKEKSIAVQVNGLNQVWMPISQCRDLEHVDEIGGVWIKSWWVGRNLQDIFKVEV